MRNYKDVIRKLMRASGWSNVKLSDESGLAKNYISELITDGKRPNPSFETLESIARAFGESVSVFSDGSLPEGVDKHEKYQPYINQLIEIIDSKHTFFVPAILANIAGFHSSILIDRENTRLKQELSDIKKEKDYKPRKRSGSTA